MRSLLVEVIRWCQAAIDAFSVEIQSRLMRLEGWWDCRDDDLRRGTRQARPFLRSYQLDSPEEARQVRRFARYDDNFRRGKNWFERDAAIRYAEELEAEFEEARSRRIPRIVAKNRLRPTERAPRRGDRLLAKLTEEQQLRRELESSVASCAKQQQQQALLSTVSTTMRAGDRGTAAAAAAAAAAGPGRESRVYTPDATHCFRP